jgi:hypothetical protein
MSAEKGVSVADIENEGSRKYKVGGNIIKFLLKDKSVIFGM